MTDRPANWRMPSIKQIEKMAIALNRKVLAAPALDDDLLPEYWQALLDTGLGSVPRRSSAQEWRPSRR
jgi:hypothetical protein